MGGNSSKPKELDIPNSYDEKKRTNVAKEIVETERTYVRHLQNLIKVFLVPLKEAAETDQPILTSNEIKDIFGIIEVIVNFHSTLLGELDERMKIWSPAICLGDIFSKNHAFFKMISTYVNGYNQGLMTYMHCKQTEKQFAQFLDKVMVSGVTNLLELQSYLIMPVQRLPRYVLMLTELVKYSNLKHPGYPSLVQSLEAVRGVADFVNEAKRSAEGSLRTLQIQENLVGKRARPILEPTRKYYSEGTFTWLNSRKKEPRPLQYHKCYTTLGRYFLFHDSILLATPEKSFFQSTADKFKLKILEPLVSVEVQETLDDSGAITSKFDIQTSHKTFTVVCEEEDVDVDKWIKLFYWLKSGCGPRYEKVNAEAQKRNYSKSDTLDNIRSQKKKDEKSNGTLPRSTVPPTDIKQETKASEKASDAKAEPKQTPKSDVKGDTAPKQSDPKQTKSNEEKAPLKNSAENTKAVSLKASAEVKPPSPTPPAKSAASSPAPPAKSAAKSPPPPAKGKPEPTSTSAKGKPEPPADPPKPKPPRPKSPPPPKKESAKKPEASPPAPERRPSISSSLSAFFGINGTNTQAPAASPSPPAGNAKASPASPRDAKQPATSKK